MMMWPHSAQVAHRERKQLGHGLALFSRQVINHVRPESGWKVLVIDSASLKVIDRSASFLSASRCVPVLLLDCSSSPDCNASFSSGAFLAPRSFISCQSFGCCKGIGICWQWNLQKAAADSELFVVAVGSKHANTNVLSCCRMQDILEAGVYRSPGLSDPIIIHGAILHKVWCAACACGVRGFRDERVEQVRACGAGASVWCRCERVVQKAKTPFAGFAVQTLGVAYLASTRCCLSR
jgi:hypothetical protein